MLTPTFSKNICEQIENNYVLLENIISIVKERNASFNSGPEYRLQKIFCNFMPANIAKYFKLTNYVNFLKHRFFNYRKSYSQSGEDLIIDFILSDQKKGFYVDVGANHPRRFNNTYLFYKKGWGGINIEPNQKFFKLFLRWRPKDKNLSIGIATNSGELNFCIFKEDTLSTFSKETAEEYKRLGYSFVGSKKIQVEPLRIVIEKYLPAGIPIDLISIDTEGYNMQVLESNDWEKYRPKFIIIETTVYNQDGSSRKDNSIYDKYLDGKSYEKYADTYINTIYIEKEFAIRRLHSSYGAKN